MWIAESIPSEPFVCQGHSLSDCSWRLTVPDVTPIIARLPAERTVGRDSIGAGAARRFPRVSGIGNGKDTGRWVNRISNWKSGAHGALLAARVALAGIRKSPWSEATDLIKDRPDAIYFGDGAPAFEAQPFARLQEAAALAWSESLATSAMGNSPATRRSVS